MKTSIKFAWLALLLSGIAQGTADPMKASGLLNVCIAVAHPNTQNPQVEPIHRPLCTGYMSGWLGGVDGAMTADEKGFVQIVSIEDGVSPVQMAKVFVLYMENHPEEENKDAHVALMHALLDAKLVTLVSPGKDTGK